MCGIVALFSRRDPISEVALERAINGLHHRGPDGQRQWVARDRRVALGHARLSIIDLATGDQPIANQDERTRIVVNGEFYGYESIQRELEQNGPTSHPVGQRDSAALIRGPWRPVSASTAGRVCFYLVG